MLIVIACRPQDLDSIETFDQTGAADYKDFLDEYDTVFEEFGRDAGDNLKGNRKLIIKRL